MKNDFNLEEARHTAAHILAAASKVLHPETALGVGPAIENGFYHDIDVSPAYSETDLAMLQTEMEKIKAMDLPITHREVPKAKARELFKDDKYKLELIEDIPGKTVGISDMGDGFFVTLCKGGHVKSTGKVGHFLLTHLAGVYWKGDANNSQLQRIYGVLFETSKELRMHMNSIEEAKKRDHRKLGKELDLFTFSPLVGSGLPLFTPRGTVIRQALEDLVQSIQEPMGYQRVSIPHITKPDLYKTSGHWDKFKDDLFKVKGHGDDEFVMKPMNCPHHTQIYASKPRSYKDLPLRYSEVTIVYRDEQPGELQGLSRVRSITQDDAHAFCRPDQIEHEIGLLLDAYQVFHRIFDFEVSIRLSLRDSSKKEAYLGTDEVWDKAQDALRSALKARSLEFEEVEGEAAFYGPKIDFIGKDSLGRSWQISTIQLDFNMPARFELTYTDSDGSAKTPVMIHRAILGSVERFMALIIEHYAGNFPLWLAPTQVMVLPIADAHADYAQGLVESLKEAGLRVEIDNSGENIGKRIRSAEVMKTPVILVVGDKEMEAGTVAGRIRGLEGSQMLRFQDIVTKLSAISANRLSDYSTLKS